MHLFGKQPRQIAFRRGLLAFFAIATLYAIPAQPAHADHPIPPFGPDVPELSESYRDEAVPVALTYFEVFNIIYHPIAGWGGHGVYAKTVLSNPSTALRQAQCELRTTSDNFDRVTATMPPRWTDSSGRTQDGSVSVSLQAIDPETLPRQHFAQLRCRVLSGAPLRDYPMASWSKVWAVAAQI